MSVAPCWPNLSKVEVKTFKLTSTLSNCHNIVALTAVLSVVGPSSSRRALYVQPSDSSWVAAILIAKVSLIGILTAPCNFVVFHSGTDSIDHVVSASPPISGDLLTILITPPIVFLPNKTPCEPFKTSTLSRSNIGARYCSPRLIAIPSMNWVTDWENPLFVPDPTPLM